MGLHRLAFGSRPAPPGSVRRALTRATGRGDTARVRCETVRGAREAQQGGRRAGSEQRAVVEGGQRPEDGERRAASSELGWQRPAGERRRGFLRSLIACLSPVGRRASLPAERALLACCSPDRAPLAASAGHSALLAARPAMPRHCRCAPARPFERPCSPPPNCRRGERAVGDRDGGHGRAGADRSTASGWRGRREKSGGCCGRPFRFADVQMCAPTLRWAPVWIWGGHRGNEAETCCCIGCQVFWQSF